MVNNAEDFLKHTGKPTYITHKVFDKDFAAILLNQFMLDSLFKN